MARSCGASAELCHCMLISCLLVGVFEAIASVGEDKWGMASIAVSSSISSSSSIVPIILRGTAAAVVVSTSAYSWVTKTSAISLTAVRDWFSMIICAVTQPLITSLCPAVPTDTPTAGVLPLHQSAAVDRREPISLLTDDETCWFLWKKAFRKESLPTLWTKL